MVLIVDEILSYLQSGVREGFENRHWKRSCGARRQHAVSAAHAFLEHKTLDARYAYALKRVREAYLEGRSLRILEVGCNEGYATAVMARYDALHARIVGDLADLTVGSGEQWIGQLPTAALKELFALGR